MKIEEFLTKLSQKDKIVSFSIKNIINRDYENFGEILSAFPQRMSSAFYKKSYEDIKKQTKDIEKNDQYSFYLTAYPPFKDNQKKDVDIYCLTERNVQPPEYTSTRKSGQSKWASRGNRIMTSYGISSMCSIFVCDLSSLDISTIEEIKNHNTWYISLKSTQENIESLKNHDSDLYEPFFKLMNNFTN